MKCLKIARLQDFAPNTPGLLGALSGPQTLCREVRIASRRTPLWKFLPTGLIDVNETVYVRQGNILATAYKGRNGRKPVRMLSTYAHAASLNGKPAIIELYNKNMGGVDGADQLIHFYNDNRKFTSKTLAAKGLDLTTLRKTGPR